MVAPPSPVYTFGDFRLDRGSGLLFHNNQPIPLTPKVFDTLLILVENSGRLVEKDEFMKRLWPGTFVGEDALAQNISLLRKALAESGSSTYIVTVPKRGYRFEAEVIQPRILRSGGLAPIERMDRSLRKTEKPLEAESVGYPAIASGKNWGTFASVMIGLAILIVTAFALLRNTRSSGVETIVIHGLAVLPLESLSGDPSQAYFADGLTDQLITDLSQISGLRVISRTSVMQYKGTRKPLSQITRDLNVDAVVEGTILKSGNQVRITAQLIQSSPERHLWARTYIGDLTDVLTLQQRVSGDIASSIRSNFSQQDQAKLKRIRPINPDAYDAYLRALYLQNQQSGEALQKAVAYYQDALRIDPNYALAYVGLAHAYSELSYRDVLPPREANEKAKIASLRAFQLDPSLAETRTALASIEHDTFEWEAAKTEKELRTAIELNVNYAPAHDRLSMLLQEQGRSDEAIQEAKRALEFDPLSINIGTHLADAYYFARQYKQAIAQRRRVLDLHPSASEPNQNLIIDYLADGDLGQFLVQAQQWMEISGETSGAEAAARLRSVKPTNYHGGLQILIQQAMAQRKTAYASAMWIATLYAEDGDKETAMTWLEKGYDDRDPDILFMRVDAALDGLHSDPRFQRLSAVIGAVL